MCLSQPSMDGTLDAIAKEGCSSLLEEVFLDLEVGLAPLAPGLEHEGLILPFRTHCHLPSVKVAHELSCTHTPVLSLDQRVSACFV